MEELTPEALGRLAVAATQAAGVERKAAPGGQKAGPEFVVHLESKPVLNAADPLFAAARRLLVFQKRPPASLKSPAYLTAGWQCASARLGERELLVLMNSFAPPRLAVDTDFDGNLTEERWRAAEVVKGGAGDSSRLRYGPIACSIPGGKLQIFIERDAEGRFWVLPAEYREGMIAPAPDQPRYRVALVDCDFDGRYDGLLPAESNPLTDPPSDCVGIDQNLNGRFDSVQSGRWEVQPLTAVWAFGQHYVRASVEPDGSAVHLQPVWFGTGELDVGTPDAELVVVGPGGVVRLPAGRGKWWLPEGSYQCWLVRLRHKDEASNTTWTLASTSRTRNLQDFEIEAGKVIREPVGGPLTAGGSDASGGTAAGAGSIQPGSVLVDSAGIEYKPVERDGQPVAEPAFRPVFSMTPEEPRRVWRPRPVRYPGFG